LWRRQDLHWNNPAGLAVLRIITVHAVSGINLQVRLLLKRIAFIEAAAAVAALAMRDAP